MMSYHYSIIIYGPKQTTGLDFAIFVQWGLRRSGAILPACRWLAGRVCCHDYDRRRQRTCCQRPPPPGIGCRWLWLATPTTSPYVPLRHQVLTSDPSRQITWRPVVNQWGTANVQRRRLWCLFFVQHFSLFTLQPENNASTVYSKHWLQQSMDDIVNSMGLPFKLLLCSKNCDEQRQLVGLLREFVFIRDDKMTVFSTRVLWHFSSDVVLETKVLVPRRLEDKNKVLVLVLVLTKNSWQLSRLLWFRALG